MQSIEIVASSFYCIFHRCPFDAWNNAPENVKCVWRNFTPLIKNGIWDDRHNQYIKWIVCGEFLYGVYLQACGYQAISNNNPMYAWDGLPSNIRDNWNHFAYWYNHRWFNSVFDAFR